MFLQSHGIGAPTQTTAQLLVSCPLQHSGACGGVPGAHSGCAPGTAGDGSTTDCADIKNPSLESTGTLATLGHMIAPALTAHAEPLALIEDCQSGASHGTGWMPGQLSGWSGWVQSTLPLQPLLTFASLKVQAAHAIVGAFASLGPLMAAHTETARYGCPRTLTPCRA
jgi:hypothetical protein